MKVREMNENILVKQNRERIRKVFGYILTFFSLLFILGFFTRTDYDPFFDTSLNPTWMYYVFSSELEYFVGLKLSLFLFSLQFIYFVYWMISKRKCQEEIFSEQK